jgi:signal transduction histidine kinase
MAFVRRGRRELWAAALCLCGLTCFVLSVYLVVVLGIGTLVDVQGSPSIGLSVVATAAVALGFEPVRQRLLRLVNRAIHGTSQSPYDVLRSFSETVHGAYDSEEVPARMSKLLAEGAAARWAQVWLVVGGRLSLSATWPSSRLTCVDPPVLENDARDASGPHRRAMAVRHDGELLGVLRLEEHPGRPLTSVEQRLFAGLAAQAGLVLRAARLRAELSRRLEELSERAEQLRRSRRRLIATQDDERAKLERDIHDGAQQHLVALTVNLRLASSLLATSPARAARLLGEQALAAEAAIQTLEQLSRGIYPRRLIVEGLAPALRAATATGPLRVTVSNGSTRRTSAEVEAALYFCCMEAVQNAAKHAAASQARIQLDVAPDGDVRLAVEDDGRGFDQNRTRPGAGLANMRDRVDAVHGQLDLRSAPGVGTRLEIRVPPRLRASTAA